ncbi:carbon-nitrogen family hydrolase [Thalassobacillus pellis]|uniref:carbon-nitrogen family hydrolase n=1 Tax=Thalassobacillus pellis TaxID=748008 RepID=UPI001961B4FC|nr:carbon-nitrogen family hydrolase [Thalassobacillus pellis]MBM7551992.1 putative amidohydrolase [Thalassobacillus pellis]
MSWKVACIQMDVAYGDPETNYKKAEEKIAKAAEQADLVVLPEMWTTGYDLTRLDEIADKNAEKTVNFLQKLAKKHDIHLVGGSVASEHEDGVRNTLLVINREGELVHQYSKLHLFQLMDEHLYLQQGEDESGFHLDGHSLAGFICYDLRFPEWMSKPVHKGAKALFVVAEWPAPRVNHWRVLLQARAIENQCYVIACNCIGADPKNTFAGHSMIIDPWGEIVAEASDQEEIMTGTIDLDEVTEIRKRIPIFEDRRPDRYS